MINLILKDLVLWLFGLFLDLMNYCADALLGLMNTDLSYFESNVPIIVKLFGVFVPLCEKSAFFVVSHVENIVGTQELAPLDGLFEFIGGFTDFPSEIIACRMHAQQ